MDILNQIVSSMSKAEIRHFKLLAGKSHSDKERKDFSLFDYIKQKGNDYNEEEIFRKIYKKSKSKNSFYRLKHRLLHDVNKSLWLLHFEQDALSQELYLIALARLHIDKKRLDAALHFLKKAEKLANQEEHFEILDLVYSLYIRLSYEEVSINPEQYIRLREANRKKMEALNIIDDILAAVTYRIKTSLNSSRDVEILRLLQKTVDEYSQDEQIRNSPKLRIKMYEAVSRMLIQQHQYEVLEPYLQETYQQFSEDRLFNKSTHSLKLQMLTYLVNTLFKNEKYRDSLAYAEKLKAAMLEYDALFYDRYEFFYYNALVTNYSELDVPKAIELLESLKQQLSKKKGSNFNSIFIYINLPLLQYRIGAYRKSVKSLISLYLFDEYKNVDQHLKLYIELFELIVRYKAKENEVLEMRIEQVEKDYEQLLQTDTHRRDSSFLQLLQQMNEQVFRLGEDDKVYESMRRFLAERASQHSIPIFDYHTFIEEQLQYAHI